jgi:hypothetical protein
MNKLLVLPGETAEKDCGLVALRFRERVLNGLVILLSLSLLEARFFLQSPALILQALAD